MKSLLQALEGRNPSKHQMPAGAELTPGGREVYRRIRRPVATCNLLAVLAGFGEVTR